MVAEVDKCMTFITPCRLFSLQHTVSLADTNINRNNFMQFKSHLSCYFFDSKEEEKKNLKWEIDQKNSLRLQMSMWLTVDKGMRDNMRMAAVSKARTAASASEKIRAFKQLHVIANWLQYLVKLCTQCLMISNCLVLRIWSLSIIPHHHVTGESIFGLQDMWMLKGFSPHQSLIKYS